MKENEFLRKLDSEGARVQSFWVFFAVLCGIQMFAFKQLVVCSLLPTFSSRE